MADPPGSLGEYIRRQRELHELSMRRVADMAGISNPYLSQIERGLRAPSEKVIQAIADSLDLSADTVAQYVGRSSGDPEGASGVEVAIARDPRLKARQRQALLEVYRAFVRSSG